MIRTFGREIIFNSVDQTQKKREKTSKRLIALFGSFLAVACVAILLLINTVSDMRREGGWLFSQVITESHHITEE